MRERFGVLWPFISFFAVSLAQHPMLVGMTLPLAGCILDPTPALLGVWDVLAMACCCVGLVVGAVADTQLWEYMNRKDTTTDLVLKMGLWRYGPLTAFQSMLHIYPA
jgi:steroid 5-alpha reductase family enzyme